MSNILPLTVIMINEEVNPDEVAHVLSEFLDEVPMRESILHRLFDYIGF